MLFKVSTPIPKDIPLELPLPEWLLVTLLIVSFLAHIIFINLMLGGSIITLWAQIKGLKNKEYDTFAHEVAKTITVNKSMAVVLGVAPLLCINTLYTIYFYSANALTGFAWILIIPLVTVAFLLTYLHKYTWDALAESRRVHIGIIATAVGIFLFIPLIFLTNVNLLMFPEKWGTVSGFLDALVLPNVFPRYFEFLGACITITGVFLVGYHKRLRYRVEKLYTELTRNDLMKLGYNIAFIGLGLQILFGVVVVLTLPSKGYGFDVLISVISAGVMLVISAIYTWKSMVAAPENRIYYGKIVTFVLFYLVIYGGSRQMYRHNALSPHQKLVAAKTKEFQKQSEDARLHPVIETVEADTTLGEFAVGAGLFKKNCSSCHQEKEKLVGPPMTEMVSIYKENRDGLKAWIKAPGKKRPDYPQMPSFGSLSEGDLDELSKYILSINSK